jgi:hypothetical protein
LYVSEKGVSDYHHSSSSTHNDHGNDSSHGYNGIETAQISSRTIVKYHTP